MTINRCYESVVTVKKEKLKMVHLEAPNQSVISQIFSSTVCLLKGNPDHSSIPDSNLEYSGFQCLVFRIPVSRILRIPFKNRL